MKDFKLRKKFGEQWLKALRSGEYTQLEGSLIHSQWNDNDEDYIVKDKKCACCLGVAALELGANPLTLVGCDLPADLQEETIKKLKYPQQLLSGDLPDILAGFNDGMIVKYYRQVEEKYPNIKLPEKNKPGTLDGEVCVKLSFIEIADWIEQNVKFY